MNKQEMGACLWTKERDSRNSRLGKRNRAATKMPLRMNSHHSSHLCFPLSPMGADQWGYVWCGMSVRIELTLFRKGHGGPAER
jgi:hypothetical protein